MVQHERIRGAAAYTFGTAGRNILRGTWLFVGGPRARPPHPARRRRGLWVEAQVFNLFNRVNYNLPELYVDEAATFGRIFSAKAARQAQLAVRFNF